MARAVTLSSPVISLGYWKDSCSSGFTKIIRSTLSAERLVLRTYSALQGADRAAATAGDRREEKCSANKDAAGEGHDEEGEALPITIIVQCDVDPDTRKCSTCGMRLEDNDTVVLLGAAAYHATCVVCGKCGGAINPGSGEVLVHNESSVVCKQCVPKCFTCGETVDYKYIHVLNNDYHDSCLQCSHCHKVFGNVEKVYASNGEPCCAVCVKPVFEEDWYVQDDQQGQDVTHVEAHPPKATIKKSRTFSTNSPLLTRALSSSMASLTGSIAIASPLVGPMSTANSAVFHQFVLYDKRGLSLLKSFCVEDSSVELLAFWLDIEHIKQSCKTSRELTQFAHQIMLKYIGYYAELPLCLPKYIEDHITSRMYQDTLSNDIFNEAQQFVCNRLEKEVLPRFFESENGQSYIRTANLTPDMLNRGSCDPSVPIKARVVDCDKRCLGSKYYVYEIEVEMENERFTVYRRYSEFHTLHDRMKATFSVRVLPPLPKKIYFGRSQVRSVAKQRMKDLEAYIQGLLKFSALSCSMELRRFLTQTETDKEDEAFNKKIQKLTS